MLRWILFFVLLLAGVVAIGFGIYIELEVQYEVGNWTGAANLLYGREIESYREQVLIYLIAGPILLFLAYVCRPRFSKKVDAKTKRTEPWTQP